MTTGSGAVGSPEPSAPPASSGTYRSAASRTPSRIGISTSRTRRTPSPAGRTFTVPGSGRDRVLTADRLRSRRGGLDTLATLQDEPGPTQVRDLAIRRPVDDQDVCRESRPQHARLALDAEMPGGAPGRVVDDV